MTQITILGLQPQPVPYLSALHRQRELHAEVAAGSLPDQLLLLEHRAVYTAGKRTLPEELPTDGSEVIHTDRGGKLTWHGPGQLVGYPIVRLPQPVDVVAYVRRIEALLLDVVHELGIPAHRVEGRSGVWVTNGLQQDKLGAIGIRVAAGTTMHGFALNCSNTLTPYEGVVACGIRDAGTTSISALLGRTVTPAEVIPLVTERFDRVVIGAQEVAAA